MDIPQFAYLHNSHNSSFYNICIAFIFFTVTDKAAIGTCIPSKYRLNSSFSYGKIPKSGLAGQMIGVCLTFEVCVKLFSRPALPFFFSTSSV